MTTLHKILQTHEHNKHATDTGTKMHLRLQHVCIDDEHCTGDADLIGKITSNPEIAKLFCRASKTEVPIAGTINNRFISRRIDRLWIDDTNKTIHILDYKTDTNRDTYHSMYVSQIHEYALLLKYIYPTYKIKGYILWTRDFLLENIPIK